MGGQGLIPWKDIYIYASVNHNVKTEEDFNIFLKIIRAIDVEDLKSKQEN